MIWHLVRYLVTFAFPIFYKRIQGRNSSKVMTEGPAIIAMNHPNAFTDPIGFTFVTYPLRVYYLARGDAFKPGLASWLLEQLGIVPIFRIQDAGKEGLKKNDEAYRRVNALLKKNNKIIVFAEGLCIQERRLRPLKKGVARMVFGGYNYLNNDKLVVIPVGVNYSKPDKFRSTLFYNIGEPIPVKDFIEEFNKNEARANNLFLQILEPKMKELITHINNKDYDDVVIYIEDLCKREMLTAQGLNYKDLEHDYRVTKQITEMVNNAEVSNKEMLDEFKLRARSYFKDLKKCGMRDWLINPINNKKITNGNLYTRWLLLFLGMPIHVLGLIGNYLPYKATERLTTRILKGNKEFYSSIAIGAGIFIVLLNYILWFILVYSFSDALIWPFVTLLMISLCSWFSLHFHFFILKTRGLARALKNKDVRASFIERRKELLSLINKF